jgi:hypothetical protein
MVGLTKSYASDFGFAQLELGLRQPNFQSCCSMVGLTRSYASDFGLAQLELGLRQPFIGVSINVQVLKH